MSSWPVGKQNSSNVVVTVFSEVSSDLDLLVMAIAHSAVICHFEKDFAFPASTPSLPPTRQWFSPKSSSASPFSSLREDLNRVKGLLNRLPLPVWHAHTAAQNPAGDVILTLRKTTRPELLTQAWCKFTEVLSRYPELLPVRCLEGNETFVSAHLCEAPGAFVSALNHFLASKKPSVHSNWNWTATSLNPYYEGNCTSSMINDDRFILHTLENWDFGSDATGDILTAANRNHWARRLSSLCHLVTADGSIDCQGDPARQEEIVAPLHLSEVAVAVNILAPGGSLVLKTFTMFENSSHCLMLLLNSVFDKVTVFKPATSKEGNSEVYVICLGYNDSLTTEQKKLLLERSSLSDYDLFSPDSIPRPFLNSLAKCATKFKDLQCKVILKNLDTFQGDEEAMKDTKKLRALVASEYVRLYNIVSIEKAVRVVAKPAMTNFQRHINLDERREEGTFEDRVKHWTRLEEISRLRQFVASFKVDWLSFAQVQWVMTRAVRKELVTRRGKPVTNLLSSKFCPAKLLKCFTKIQDMLKDHVAVEEEDPCRSSEKRRRLSLSVWQETPECNEEHLSTLCHAFPTLRQGLEKFTCVANECDQEALKEDLEKLTEVVSRLENGSHLALQNFGTLTRLNINILVILASCFQKIGFARTRGYSTLIILLDLKEDVSSVQSLLADIITALSIESKDQVQEVLPITDVITEPLYPVLVAYNIITLREKAFCAINRLES